MAKRMKMDKGELQSLIAVGFIIFGFIIVKKQINKIIGNK